MSLGEPGPKRGLRALFSPYSAHIGQAGDSSWEGKRVGLRKGGWRDEDPEEGQCLFWGGPPASRKSPQNPLEVPRKGQQSCTKGPGTMTRPPLPPRGNVSCTPETHPGLFLSRLWARSTSGTGRRRARIQDGTGSHKEPICSLFPPPAPPGYGPRLSAGRTVGRPSAAPHRAGRVWGCQAHIDLQTSGRKVTPPSSRCHPHSGDAEPEAQRGERMPPVAGHPAGQDP